jgi:hypothetical protein
LTSGTNVAANDPYGGLPEKRIEPRLIICEGASDHGVHAALMKAQGLSGAQIHVAKGRDNFSHPLRGARVQGYKAVLIVSDNDDDPASSFDAVCEHIKNADYGDPPTAPRQPIVASQDNPSLTVLMIPWDGEMGAIETLCLPALEDMFADKIQCLDDFCRCTGVRPNWNVTRQSEMRVECLLSCTQENEPNIGLGYFVARSACQLDFQHACFDKVSGFLRQFSVSPI